MDNHHIHLNKLCLFPFLVLLVLTVSASSRPSFEPTPAGLRAFLDRSLEHLGRSEEHGQQTTKEKPLLLSNKAVIGATTTTIIDYNFNLFDKFLEGFKANFFSPNFMICSAKLRATALDYN